MDPLTCPFCNPTEDEIVLANSLCYARYARYPASPGHLLLIPFRHTPTLFDATDAELAALTILPKYYHRPVVLFSSRLTISSRPSNTFCQ